jgi:ubiquinone/menaquinone biosynthesis C-methylase UbiE
VILEAGVQSGFCILDYGCGPGGYIAPLAELAGPSGKIHALDTNPLAVKEVKKIAAHSRITTWTLFCCMILFTTFLNLMMSCENYIGY